jgi:hypothetical protein
MNKLWNFGDSFATFKDNYDSYPAWLANSINYEHVAMGEGGFSNEQIFSKILKYYNFFKKNDILIINFSFFSRMSYVNEFGEIQSTNTLFDDNNSQLTKDGVNFLRTNNEKMIDYLLSCNYDYNIKLFNNMSILLDNLIKIGVMVYSVFIKKEELYLNKKIFTINEYNLNVPNELFFQPAGYFNWLVSMGWKNEEDIHYTNGIQKSLAYEYAKRMLLLNPDSDIIQKMNINLISNEHPPVTKNLI